MNEQNLITKAIWDTVVKKYRDDLLLMSSVFFSQAPGSPDTVMRIEVLIKFKDSHIPVMLHERISVIGYDDSHTDNYYFYPAGAKHEQKRVS